jgi:signal peptidase I
MFTTAVFVLLMLFVLVSMFVLWVQLLKLGARWMKVPDVTTRAALITLLILIALQLSVSVALEVFDSSIPLPVSFVVALTVSFVVPAAVIARFFRTSWRRAFCVWLPTLLATVFEVLFAFLLVRPFLIESFKIPANGMAPTFLGVHFTDVCPTCGRPAYGSVFESAFDRPAICDKFHVHTTEPTRLTEDGDRIMVAKYIRPRRWDAIAFRYPGDPKLIYCQRVVGLPGETVLIKDGAVWINGQKLELPASLSGLEYVTEMPRGPNMPPMEIFAGTPDRPAVLGKDDYFVLGDFSVQSMDSRLWEKGAPGHPPYAVPEANIIGVATHIFWPPNRWRILR